MHKKYTSQTPTFLTGPVLRNAHVQFLPSVDWQSYPFSLNLIKNLKEIPFSSKVTFFVGENGSGKSTLMEALAYKAGFGFEGGSKNISFKTSHDATYAGVQQLADQLTLSWRKKTKDGYFFRAESFHNVATYLEGLPGGDAFNAYGGKSLHDQSHGEAFFSFFNNRLGKGGFFILDEPEAALSPQRQLSLLSIINQLCKHDDTQFIIATHSPILLAYPEATIYSCDGGALQTIEYTDTDHYQLTKQFLDHPQLYLRNLFGE